MAYSSLPTVTSGEFGRASWANLVDSNFDDHEARVLALEAQPSGTTVAADLAAHEADTANPHSVTKTQVGLGSVENYAVASQAEAEAGTATDKYMTPERTAQAITALGGGAGGSDTIALKTADTTRNNVGGFGNTVADPHMTIAVAANEIWFFDVWLLLESASTSSDWRFKFNVPSGANIYHGSFHNGTNFVWTLTGVATTPQLVNDATAELLHGSRASGLYTAQFSGIYIGGANAGNVELAWCQETATVSDSTIKTGSFLRGRKLSA